MTLLNHTGMHCSSRRYGKINRKCNITALTKAQDITHPTATIDSRNFRVNHTTNSSYETNWTSPWPITNIVMSQQLENDTNQTQRPYETHTSPHAYVNQQPPNQTFFDFKKSVIELFRCPTELAHSTQCLHQQTTEVLNNIAKSSLLQENLYFINDISIFKSKDPQSFYEWLEQIDKDASLTNKDPYKLAPAKSQT